ncbi:MAG: hypothetical protein HN904_00075 [Victivallales bacterium]|nr:hypothetical protein [Victivallales bacterium]
MQYTGSGITTGWVRVFICAVFTVGGLGIALSSLQRSPTRAQIKYMRAVAAAEQDGRDTATVPRPPEQKMWRDGFPGLTLFGLGFAAVGVAAMTEPLWRKRQAADTGRLPSPE